MITIPGHDYAAIAKAFAHARSCKGKPTVIIAQTTKGCGSSVMENKAGWHGKAPNDEEYAVAMADLEKIGAELK